MTDENDANPPKANISPPATDYEVGYGRPPKEFQIKPGERRNPHGRPTGSRNAKTILKQEHDRPIRVQQDGRVRRKRAIDLIMRKDVADALKGDERAKKRQIAFALEMAAEEESRQALKSQRQMIAEDEAILARYLPDISQKEDES